MSKNGDNFMLANSDIILIFSIHGQFWAMGKPNSGSLVHNL